MKNKILLATLLAFNVMTPAISGSSSATEIKDKTVELGLTYYELGIKIKHYITGQSDDRAALIKVCDIILALLPAAKEIAKKEAHTEEAHEKLYEYEKDIEPQIKAAVHFLKTSISNPDMSDAQLREMLNSYIAMVPQIFQSIGQ